MRLLTTHTGRKLEPIESTVPELLLAQKCGQVNAPLFVRWLNTGCVVSPVSQLSPISQMKTLGTAVDMVGSKLS